MVRRRWRSPGRDTQDMARRRMPWRSALRSRLAMRRTGPRGGAPSELHRNGERPRSIGGVQENGFCTEMDQVAHFLPETVVHLGTYPSYRRVTSEHFVKGLGPVGWYKSYLWMGHFVLLPRRGLWYIAPS